MMTFEQFQAAGKDCTNIGEAIGDECLDGAAGRLYCDTLYIERWSDDRAGIAPPNGPTWLLTLFNEQWDGELIELERKLYEFALSEGYCEAA